MTIETAKRGQLTPDITCMIDAAFGEKFAPGFQTKALRLIPYLWDCAINRSPIDPRKVCEVERGLISSLRNQGMLTGGASEAIWLREDAWQAMSRILYAGYVDYDNRQHDAVARIAWRDCQRVEIDLRTAAKLIDEPRWQYAVDDADLGLDPWRMIEGCDPWRDGSKMGVWFGSGGDRVFEIDDVPDNFRFFAQKDTMVRYYKGEFE